MTGSLRTTQDVPSVTEGWKTSGRKQQSCSWTLFFSSSPISPSPQIKQGEEGKGKLRKRKQKFRIKDPGSGAGMTATTWMSLQKCMVTSSGANLRSRTFLPSCVCVHSHSVTSTLYDPMDWSPPGSSVHGIFQARILEWVAISSSRASSQPRDRTCVSLFPALAGKFFTTVPPGKMPFRQQTQHSYDSPKPAPCSFSMAHVISVWSHEATEGECMSWCHTQPFKYVMVAVQVSTPKACSCSPPAPLLHSVLHQDSLPHSGLSPRNRLHVFTPL